MQTKIFRVESEDNITAFQIRDALMWYNHMLTDFDVKVTEIHFMEEDKEIEKKLKDSGHL